MANNANFGAYHITSIHEDDLALRALKSNRPIVTACLEAA